MAALTDAQLKALETTERIASCFSLVGTLFILVTFVSSPNFRKPINRLVFYASWGNTLCNIATLMSESPIRLGADSHLCQFQAFLIQMFVPADAFWNLAMAMNVYLTLFRKYNAKQLKALEWKYHLLCYGTPFLIAFILLFVGTPSRGKIYGPAVLWCWISDSWDFLRVALCYGPAWLCIITSLTIYSLAGREIFKKRHELRAVNHTLDSGSLTNYKTTDVEVTSELENLSPLGDIADCFVPPHERGRHQVIPSYERYTVNIAAAASRPSVAPPMPHGTRSMSVSAQHPKNRAAMEANRAAYGYTKVAALFFVSLCVTWVPSSVNRVYSLVHPSSVSLGLSFVAGVVLSLMGFWNSVIYIATSRAACKALFFNMLRRWKGGSGKAGEEERLGRVVARRRSRGRINWGDDWERLAVEREA